MLGGGDDVALRGVADDDALLRGIGDVDVVQARAGSAHDAQVGRSVEKLLVDEGLAAHDDAVVLGDDGEQLVTGSACTDVHLATRREQGDGVIVHELGHKDLGIFEVFQPASLEPRAAGAPGSR